MFLRFAFACIGLFLIPVADAQDEELETINVIASSENETGDVQHEEHTGSHQRIPKAELQRHDVNLADILANETGVQFRQIGGLGTLSTVTLRGGSSQQTGIYLDGILLNSAGNGIVDLSLLDLLNLSSVDIYRGSTPAQLSNSNIGGAVNLRTLSARNDGPATNAVLSSGSFDTHRAQFAHRSTYKQWDVVAAASHENSSNRFSFTNNNTTPLNPNDDRLEKRNNAPVLKLSALSRVGLQWNTDARTDLLVQISSRDLGVPEWRNSSNNEASFDTDKVEFQLTNRFDGIGNWNTSLSLFQHFQNNHYLDARSQIGLGAQDTQSTVNTTGVKAYWEHIGDRGTLSLSTSLRNETLESRDELSANQNYNVKRQSIHSNVQFAFFNANEKLLLTPSLRMQIIEDKNFGNDSSNNDNRSAIKFSPQIGARYAFNDSLSVQSNMGKFVREPNFSELFGSTGLIVGNRNLLPEDGINADVGISYKLSENYSFTGSLFGSWRDELVALAFDSQGIGRSVNTGKANVFGVELGNSWRFSKQLSMRLNTTYQQTQNFSANPALNKKELPGEARLSAHVKLQHLKRNVKTWFESNYKSDFYYDPANLLPASGYWLHNAGIEHQWHKLQLGLTINNIGNDNIQDFNGFPRPGRAYFVSINYRL